MLNSNDTYKDFARFYDWYVKDFSDDLPLYLHFCKNSHSILEVGCGSGRVLKTLAESGFRVLGVDISDEMLTIAREKFPEYITSGQIRLANFNFLEAPLTERFDRILVTFYTINYLLDEADCKNFLNNIRQSAAENGLILMDCFYPRPLQKPETASVWYEKEFQTGDAGIKLRDRRSMNGKIEERTQEYITAGSLERIETQRKYYSKEDIYGILEDCGFTNIEFTDGYDISGFHKLKDGERTGASFVIKAEF